MRLPPLYDGQLSIPPSSVAIWNNYGLNTFDFRHGGTSCCMKKFCSTLEINYFVWTHMKTKVFMAVTNRPSYRKATQESCRWGQLCTLLGVALVCTHRSNRSEKSLRERYKPCLQHFLTAAPMANHIVKQELQTLSDTTPLIPTSNKCERRGF